MGFGEYPAVILPYFRVKYEGDMSARIAESGDCPSEKQSVLFQATENKRNIARYINLDNDTRCQSSLKDLTACIKH